MTHFCPEHCGVCPSCKQTLQQIDDALDGQYDLYANEWENNEQQASGNPQENVKCSRQPAPSEVGREH